MKEYQKIKNGKSYTVRLFDNGSACTFDQAINKKTGKGWQKSENSKTYGSHAKAMFAWAKLGN